MKFTDQKLIFDVGVHDGSDSAYYLQRGFHVVGVEASPVMVANLQQRFAAEIATGQYELLHVGVAETEGELTFWVCDDVPEWSSFDEKLAARNGSAHHPVKVRTQRFDSILAQYGGVHYCKIDIEGHDIVCLRHMHGASTPDFLSVEMHHRRGDEEIALLRELGYRRFKIISQVTRAQPMPAMTYLKGWLPNRVSRWMQEFDKRVRGAPRDEGWTFPWGSSGAFGDATPGPWHDHAAILDRWRQLRDSEPRHARHGLIDWYDFHATQ